VVTTTTAFAGRWLIPRMERLRAACGGIDLVIRATEAVVDLHAEQADLAIRYRRSPEPDLEGFPLFADRYLPVCSPRRLQQGSPIHEPADLTAHPLIHFQWKRDDPHAPTWTRWFAQAREQWQACPEPDRGGRLWFSEESHAIEATLEGQGLALLSNVINDRELANGSLVPVLDFAIEGLSFYLVYRRDSPRLAAPGGSPATGGRHAGGGSSVSPSRNLRAACSPSSPSMGH